MNDLVQEALQIVEDLGDVVFIGAVAVMLHTQITRESADLDFAPVRDLTDEFLKEKEYFQFEENGKLVRRTPRGYKIDIFTRDVSGIPLSDVIRTAVDISLGKKGKTLKIASLETLIVAKHRAARFQDADDLRTMATRKFKEIDWQSLERLTNSEC
ncbi:MAG: DUF6036 family nucleotidyltransferase [Nitrosotalea sp.]